MASLEQLIGALTYEPTTGLFFRKLKDSTLKVAGTLMLNGYIQIHVCGRLYYAHRLAWLNVHGAWPENMIDHIDGVKSNNRIANLRDVTSQTNCQNQHRAHSRNKTGLLGVQARGERFFARILVDGHHTHLGTYDTPEEAHKAYVAEKRKHHAGSTI